jgi:hypothetical protein
MSTYPFAVAPPEGPVVVRGMVEAIGDRGIKVDGRWFAWGGRRPATALTPGQLVRLEAEVDAVQRVVVLTEPVSPGPAPAAPPAAERGQ